MYPGRLRQHISPRGSHEAEGGSATERTRRTQRAVRTGRTGASGMAADKGAGSAEAVERVLPVLLVPVPAEATGRLGSRAQLHREQEVLGSLTAAGSLQVLPLAPGGRGGGGCRLEGRFRQ